MPVGLALLCVAFYFLIRCPGSGVVLPLNFIISTKTYCTVHHDGSLSRLRVCDNKANAKLKSDVSFDLLLHVPVDFPLFALMTNLSQ